ncbi:uncharacterized protein LOC113230894 [Hyposmocoma kahamanoa]|uniref:uncharacterized protein LOC113230894 n=1 Tax=Hyposmocoma kahamanoa TaxID=1477025 RepID=UPI000E6D8059|nr:uncharacterized protein LOC113230894 [Hyposmocoma kahamanoa]
MAAVLLFLAVATTVAATTTIATATVHVVGDLARRDTGDVFTITDGECGAAQCAEHGAGVSAGAGGDACTGEACVSADACACACPQRAPLFREDRELCVDDLPECSLATFGTGVNMQRIPFVYLPLKGQIIHPSREITFQNVKTPICAVSGAQFLTRKGFSDLRNTLDADVPFSLFRDEGRTFLQWSGEDDVRARMSGRVMVVRLLCRDVSATPTLPLDLRGVFTPCVAFRVQGSPPRHTTNVTEVQFAPNAHTSKASNGSGLSVTEYVAIGISSLLLGLIYVASVFLYLHIRKRKKAASDEGSTRRLKGLKKKDGTAITERDIIRISNDRVPNLSNAMGDDGVIKKNPLLNLNRQFHDSKSFPSDSGSNLSDSEDFADSNPRSEDNLINSQSKTSAVVHLRYNEMKIQNDTEVSHRDESGIERLPDEHVSIVETTDDREIARPVGTTRRKLYFNPAYFEPHLMAEPPPAALEFLTKIREVISIAKHKMAAKRFQPILNQIPEEETYPSNRNSVELYQGLGSQRSGSVVSLKRENSRKKSICVGCPGCKSDNSDLHNLLQYDAPACSNCMNSRGDKQNSIRKWLENIPTVKSQPLYNEYSSNTHHNGLVNSLLSLPSKENRCKLRKQNSFSATNSMQLSDGLAVPKRRASTMSVRSEPPLRNYNLPLPEFENEDYQPTSYSTYCQTVSRADDIRPIGLSDYRSGSLRSNAIANQRRNKFITNKNALPDMVNEAVALDHSSKIYSHSSSDEERFHGKIYNVAQNFARNNSESPLANDYETDSLERNSQKKGISTSTEYPEVPSSQASPSLSNALPLEEELTMRNAVYKHSSSNSNTPSPQRDIFIDQSHYEIIGKQMEPPKTSATEKVNQNSDYSLVSEVYVNNNYNFGSTPTSPSGSECSMGSRKLTCAIKTEENFTEEKPGCLTIEVKDPPENYIKIHESDGFEPDTLDRKHPKHKETVETIQFSRKDLIKNLTNKESPPSQSIMLRSSGTFTKTNNKIEYTAKFNSLRNDFEQRKNINERPKLLPTTFNGTKCIEDTSEEVWEEPADWVTEEGRILTLELRHSKRQRQCTPPTIKQIKNLARPDVLPPLPPTSENPIYEQPSYPPRRVESDRLPIDDHQKNVSGRSLSPRIFMKKMIEPQRPNSIPHESFYGSSSGPLRASVESQSSEYEIDQDESRKSGEYCRTSNRRPSARSSCTEINTHTFVKGSKTEGHSKPRFRRKKGSNIEDSGYLSSDSTSSRRAQRKIVIAKIVSCSDSDDTENEARSESGAESVETHSVYFGRFRNQEGLDGGLEGSFNGIKNARDSSRKQRRSKECL